MLTTVGGGHGRRKDLAYAKMGMKSNRCQALGLNRHFLGS